MTTPGSSDDVTLKYASRFDGEPDAEWEGLVRFTAYLGIVVGIARVIAGWWYFPIGPGFGELMSYGVGVRELFPMLVRGLAQMVVGATLLVAAGACLARRNWALTLMLLSEPMAIIVFGVSALSSIADAVLHPGQRNLWIGVTYAVTELIANVGYPLLAASIFRTRAVRALFDDETIEVEPEGEVDSGGENA